MEIRIVLLYKHTLDTVRKQRNVLSIDPEMKYLLCSTTTTTVMTDGEGWELGDTADKVTIMMIFWDIWLSDLINMSYLRGELYQKPS